MQLSESSNRILAGLLEARTGQQLSISRRWRIETALSGLLRDRGLGSLDQLIARLAMDRESHFAREVVEALLNNETYFFRDRSPFELVATQALPELARRRAATRRITIWSAGCSTGQEPLSIAMIFAEQAAKWAGWTIDIVATDVSQQVIDAARRGIYTQFQIQRGLGVMQMMRWFREVEGGWEADEQLKRIIRFKVHNVLAPMPLVSGFDIVLCRNLLLYFNEANRRRAFDRLAGAMAPDGWLMLGAGETVVGQTRELVPDAQLRGLYRRSVQTSGQEDSPLRRAAGA